MTASQERFLHGGKGGIFEDGRGVVGEGETLEASKLSFCERLRSRVAELVNLEEEKTSPSTLPTGLRGSSRVSRARAAMANPGGPSQKSSWRHEDTVTVPCRMEKL